jgi:hypothetical protein
MNEVPPVARNSWRFDQAIAEGQIQAVRENDAAAGLSTQDFETRNVTYLGLVKSRLPLLDIRGKLNPVDVLRTCYRTVPIKEWDKHMSPIVQISAPTIEEVSA